MLLKHKTESWTLSGETNSSALSEHVQSERTRNTRRKILLGMLAVAIVVGVGVWFLLRVNEGGIAFDDSENTKTLAPDFSLMDLQGNTFNLSGFRGKVVLLDFMATWCGPCRQEIPQLRTIWENASYKDKIVVISIDIDLTENVDALRAFVQDYPFATWVWAMDTAHLGVVYHVQAIPKTLVIDEEGYVRFTHVGLSYASTLAEEIDWLLEQ